MVMPFNEKINRILELEQRRAVPTKGRSIPLYADVAPLDIVRVSERSPIAGRIRLVNITWPDGCNFLVLVAFGRGGDIWLIPAITGTFERNNDTTVPYPLDEPIDKGEELWLIIKNGDGSNSHQISLTATVVEFAETS